MKNKSPYPQATAIKLTFTPQAWVDDYAINVDPEGETEWQPSQAYVAEMVEEYGDNAFASHTYESDDWRHDEAAPDWVRLWSGPFEVDVEVNEGSGE